jgi:extracellular matrix protein 14
VPETSPGSLGMQMDNPFFDNYQPMSVIMPWMKLLSSLFPSHVEMTTIGSTYENRPIPALRIGSPPAAGSERRKTILITAGSHAREWIGVSTANYIAYHLITSYGRDSVVTKLVDDFDWLFIPVLNVDGYVYTWEHDRLWRKNRQNTPLRFCPGVDLDRGWGFQWDGEYAKENPCSESFPGESAFQAFESNVLANWTRNEKDSNSRDFVGYLDLHSYSQQILYPYSFSCGTYPPWLEDLQELGMGLAKAIRLTSGEHYDVDSACEGTSFTSSRRSNSDPETPKKPAEVYARMETGGGSALDWFYHDVGVRYAFQIKLRDMGAYGFLLPKDYIIPTGEEGVSAIRHFGEFMLNAVSNGLKLTSKEEKTVLPVEEPQQDLRRRRR